MTQAATDHDEVEEAEDPRPSLAGVWTTALLLMAAVAFLFLFDFLGLGDGAVGAQSDTLSTGRVTGSVPEDLIGREPGGVFTIAFPVRNRGVFVPVTVTAIEPPDADGPCPWRPASVASDREDAAARAEAGGGMDGIKVSAGGTAQLYLGATFPPEDCSTDATEEVSADAMTVEYRVLGLIPRSQDVPLGTVVTTTGDLDDSRLEEPPETLD